MKEGIAKEKIFVTGNTIVDAVYQNLRLAEKNSGILESIGVKGNDYFLATVHRQENVDNIQRFRNILEGLKLLQDDFGLPVVYPIHPRARRRMQEHGLNSDSLTIVEPFDYFSFLQLESKARLILTDSGGVQEEACIKSHASPSGIILRGLKPWMLARTLSLEQSLRTFSRRPGS